MTSPVDTSVKYFSSTMTGAPVLNGVAGSLIALLDACLVTGFDTKALVSLTVASGVATATFAGTHSSLQQSVVLIAGVAGGPSGFAGMNGEQKVTGRPLATTATFATALPDGTYTGTITMKMASAGWEKVFTGTNKAVYRSLDPASTKMLLRVDDTGTTFARVVGYESMGDADTGLGAFPSAVQMPGGGYWAKSAVANTVATLWSLFSDGRIFYFWNASARPSNAINVAGWTRGFGDGIALKPGGDAYACALSYSASTNVISMYDGDFDGSGTTAAATVALPRAYTGLGSSLLHYVLPYSGYPNNMSGNDTTLGNFPSYVDGSLKLSKKYLATAVSSQPPRMDLPGILHMPQTGGDSFAAGDLVPGSGGLSGKTLIAVKTGQNLTVGLNGALFFDSTGPWRDAP